jgi:hypothetical protein
VPVAHLERGADGVHAYRLVRYLPDAQAEYRNLVSICKNTSIAHHSTILRAA